MKTQPRQPIWANLLHLSFNMWFDCPEYLFKDKAHEGIIQPYLRFDEQLWRDILQAMSAAGMNMVVLDLGDGIVYRSHPEIAVKNAWTPARLKKEIAVAQDLGIEIIPKLNFATSHDAWLGMYARMVSTETYYKVCRDLIAEVCEIFDGPRFFHLGMDEETAVNQIHSRLVVIRQFDLYWHDLNLLCDAVRENGSRPWIWSDYQWYHPLDFAENMQRDVLQSNWWYSKQIDPSTELIRSNPQMMDDPVRPRENINKLLHLKPVQAYLELEKLHFDQIPTGGTTSKPSNFAETVQFCHKNIAAKRLYGFMQTTWRATLEHNREYHMTAIELVSDVIAKNR